jgi:hypothetical protein
MTPEEKSNREMMGLKMYQARAISHETACEKYWDLDPEIESNRMLIEEALTSPMAKTAIAMEALKDAGMNQLIDMINQGKLAPPNPTQGSQENFRTSDYLKNKNQEQNPNIQPMNTMPEQTGTSGNMNV